MGYTLVCSDIHICLTKLGAMRFARYMNESKEENQKDTHTHPSMFKRSRPLKNQTCCAGI